MTVALAVTIAIVILATLLLFRVVGIAMLPVVALVVLVGIAWLVVVATRGPRALPEHPPPGEEEP